MKGARKGQPGQRELVALGALLTLALTARLAFGAHMRDDAYITLRYAEHLAMGLGFTFNATEHVLGTTTPLYTLVLAAGLRLGIPVQSSAIGLGIAADVGVVVLLWWQGRRAASSRVGLLAGLVYALLSPTVAYAVSGMETPLYLVLILGAFALAQVRRPLWCAVVCGFLTLLRPDGVLVPLVLVASDGWHHLRAGQIRPSARTVFCPLVVYAAIVAPWVLFAWRYFGSPIPQSLVAKWDLHVGRREGLLLFAEYFLDLRDRWFLPLTCFAAVGLVIATRRRALHRPLGVWTVTYAAAFLTTNKLIYPAWPFEWYFLPLLLWYSLLVGQAFDWVMELLGARLRRSVPRFAPLVVALPLIFILPSLWHLASTRASLGQWIGGREALYADIGSWLGRRGVTRETVGAPEIGALGFSYPGPILDLWGLTSPLAAGKSFDQTLTQERPDWLVAWDTDVAKSLATSAWFREHYRPVVSYQNWESRHLVTYRWYPSPAPQLGAGPALGDDFELLGRTVAVDEGATARYVHVTLTWRDRQLARRTTFSVQALGESGEVLALQDNEPQEGSRPTTEWRPGELIVDRYDLALQPSARLVSLAIIGYPTGHPAERLSWASAHGTPIGATLIAPIPDARSAPAANCLTTFDQGIALDHVGIEASTARLRLRLVWAAEGPTTDDYTVFVHALDATGQTIAQADGPPRGGAFPTSAWQAGDRVDDVHDVVLDGRAVRSLEVGLYQRQTGQRLPRRDRRGDTVVIDPGSDPVCRP